MIDLYKPSRLDWIYSTDSTLFNLLHKRNIYISSALNTILPDATDQSSRLKGRIKDMQGNLVTAPWMKSWKGFYWGCVNSPEYRTIFFNYARKCIDLGSNALHCDDSRFNIRAMDWGGCYCQYCISGFRTYLNRKFDSAYVYQNFHIPDLKTFDYLQYQKNALSDNDSYHRGLLAEYKKFMEESVGRFFDDFSKMIDAYAGRHIPLLTNNNAKWEIPNDRFDIGMSELSEHDANPLYVYEAIKQAKSVNKSQVFTLVSKNIELTKKMIACNYAMGGQLIIPWDVYISSDNFGRADRFYGNPHDFESYYAFIQKNSVIFDQYENVFYSFNNVIDSIDPQYKLITSSKHDECILIKKKNDGSNDFIIHLINMGDGPKKFKLSLNINLLTKSSKIFQIQPDSKLVRLKAKKGEYVSIESDPVSNWSIIIVQNN
jgi:hypothetical protein